MNAYKDANDLLKIHKQLTRELEVLELKISDEEKRVYPVIIDLVDKMAPNEFADIYHSLKDDSNLKFRLFKFIKDKSK